MIPLVQRLDIILEKCRGKRVLHLGCSDSPYTQAAYENGTLLHRAISEVAEKVVGFDYDDAGIEALKKFGFDDIYKADLEDLDRAIIDERFDIIIAGEMIEHLNNPGKFLTGIQAFMDHDTELVITTVNAYCGMRFFHYTFSRNGGRNEPVHPDHVAYYSYSTLRLLVERHGMEVKDFMFYDLGKNHRKAAPLIFRVANDVSVMISKQLADGIIAVCRKGTSNIDPDNGN